MTRSYRSFHRNSDLSRKSVRAAATSCPGARVRAFAANAAAAFRRLLGRHHWRAVRAAQAVQTSMVEQLGETDRGVKRANFHVLRETAVPAILVETGFLTHAATEAKMRKPDYLRRIARAIAAGIARYSRR